MKVINKSASTLAFFDGSEYKHIPAGESLEVGNKIGKELIKANPTDVFELKAEKKAEKEE